MTRERIAQLRAIFAQGQQGAKSKAGEECLAEIEKLNKAGYGDRNRKTPTLREVMEEAARHKWQPGQAEAFFDHYEMVGWVYGKSRHPIKSLAAAMRTWDRCDKQRTPVNGTNGHGIGSRFGVGA